MEFTRNVTSNDTFDNSIPIGKEIRVTYATHKTSLDLGYHGPNRGYVDIILIKAPQIIPAIQYLKINDYVAIANYAMLGVGMLYLVLVTIGLIVYRKTNTIKSTSTNFSLLTIVGMGLCFGSLCLQIGVPTNTSCILDSILLPFGFSIMIGAIIAKTYRIRVIFNNDGKILDRTIDDSHLIQGTLFFVLIEIILLLISVLLFPPAPTIVPLTGDQSHYICQSSSSMMGFILTVYNGLLLGVAGIFAFLTRNVYQQFRESGSIGFSVYNAIITAIVVLPLQVIDADLKFKIAAKSIGVFYSVFMAAILFWGPKLFYVVLMGDDNPITKKTSGLSMAKVSGKEIHKYSSRNQAALQSDKRLFSPSQ
jgi:hypothetical protein